MNFPTFTIALKRQPSHDELTLALQVYTKVLDRIQRCGTEYESAFNYAVRGLSARQWQIVRFLGFDLRPKARSMRPNWPEQVSSTKVVISKLKSALVKRVMTEVDV